MATPTPTDKATKLRNAARLRAANVETIVLGTVTVMFVLGVIYATRRYHLLSGGK